MGRTARVAEALLFGLAASSALVIGGAVGAYWQAPERVTGLALAFASGALISALAFELFAHAAETGGSVRAGIGLLGGAAVFVAVDSALERYTGTEERTAERTGLALLAAATLDGIPETMALGISLLEGSGSVLLLAIFAANLPESLVGSMDMREGGRSPAFTIGTWTAVGALLVVAAVVGRGAAGAFGGDAVAFLLSFAGGAVVAALADTLMPEAFEKGRPLVGLATAAGFFVSFILSS
jgi:ZIP family zinc transporter